MDIVYIVGPGQRDWLRWSLRSLVNLPHERVYVVGERPAFCSSAVTHLPVQRHPQKWRSAVANLRKACATQDISPNFVLMNDDFFIMRPVDGIETLNRGDLTHVIDKLRAQVTSSSYLDGMVESRKVLRQFGINSPMSYSLHTPFVYNKYALLEVLDTADRARSPRIPATDTRTMYGNLMNIGGRTVTDVKIHRYSSASTSVLPFRSTNATSWGSPITDFIREAFPDKCKYER